jgi:hypothetical protein
LGIPKFCEGKKIYIEKCFGPFGNTLNFVKENKKNRENVLDHLGIPIGITSCWAVISRNRRFSGSEKPNWQNKLGGFTMVPNRRSIGQ